MSEQWLGGELVSRHLLHELPRRVRSPAAVDVRSEPLEQRPELAARELRIDLAEVFADLLEELGGVHVSQRVRREVADRASAPVDVLQTPAGVVGRREAEVLAHL